MSGVVVVSPVVSLLFDDAGNAFLVNDGDILSTQKGILLAGKEGSNIRLLKLDADGTARVAAASLPLPTGAATEATLATLATESKLEAVRALLATIDADTSVLQAVDYATQTTLLAFKNAFDARDLATETTLQGVNTRLGEVSASPTVNTVLERLKALKDFLDAEDFSSETTLAAFKAAFDATDFATQTTLAALLSAFNAEDFASETTLVTVDAVLDTIYARLADKSQFAKLTDGTNDAAIDASGDLQVIHTDALPAGSNLLGKVQIRNPANDGDLGDTTNPFVTDAVGNYTNSGTITAVNGTVEIDTYGSAMITAEITGTWVGTLVGEYSIDGTTWYTLVGFQVGGSAVVTSTTDNGNFRANVAGFVKMRVRASAYTSGTVNVLLHAHVRNPSIPIDGNGNIGVRVVATAPPAGVDGVVIAADTPLTVGSHDTEFTIPNGQTFHLQQITAGNEDPSKGASVVVIYYDGTTEHVVARDYVNGATHSSTFPDLKKARDGTEMVGDGSTKLIRVRRLKFSGSDIAIDAVVFGYAQ